MDEWTIREVARAAGLTSRTLRHYEQIGLLMPARVGANGYRFYGEAEVARLHRVLSLRALGMPLGEIGRALGDTTSLASSMTRHLEDLDARRIQLDAQIAAVRQSLRRLSEGEDMSLDEIFEGFDHSAHETEVRERWGDDAWEGSTRRRTAMTVTERAADDARTAAVNGALRHAVENGTAPGSPAFDALIADHYRWLGDQWGRRPEADAYAGLSDLYVADERFAAVYGGEQNARAIRDAIHGWIEANLR